MQQDKLQTLLAQALTAMKAGNQIVAKSVGGIHDAVGDAKLKAAVEKGTKLRETWGERIDAALAEAGGPAGEMINPVIAGVQEVGQKIQRQAPDEASRDLGMCADGQMALHYWMAAFGTVRSYANALSMGQTADAMQACLNEAKQADEEHTAIAEHIMAG